MLQNNYKIYNFLAMFIFSQKMKSLLLSGSTLVVDRYAYSGIAFTAAKVIDILVNDNGYIFSNH